VISLVVGGRAAYLRDSLATQWILPMPDIEALLRAYDATARVADLGCGTGWSSIALAHLPAGTTSPG
jgi:methylase of polypeptide subunit release factors